MYIIDTHAQVKGLQKAGMDIQKAEAIVELIFETTVLDLSKVNKQKHIKAIQKAGMTKEHAETLVKTVFDIRKFYSSEINEENSKAAS